ncbi:MAG: potassium transporter TrkA [Planctomycetota bacterium]|nr:potassium transporter TrkA [Planctomycetota bacterium]MDA1114598.1 potassium transporter TrkA [Planctomycetota bacterium]
MVTLFAVLIVLSVSLLIVRIGSIALSMTGLSPQVSRFQARSAYFGVGFTTKEAEKVLSNPVRREIVMMLMLLGNAGIITLVSSLVLSLTKIPTTGISSHLWFRFLFLVAGISLLFVIAYSKWVDRRISTVVAWSLNRWTRLGAHDYTEMLHLAHDYSVSEFVVEAGDWICGRTLMEMRLGEAGGVETLRRGHTGRRKRIESEHGIVAHSARYSPPRAPDWHWYV